MAGNYHTFLLLDGYAMSSTDGYTLVSEWVDVHSTPFISVIAVFASGTPAGTLKLEQSNDRQSTKSTGVFPVSALTSTGDAFDTVDVPSATQGVSGNGKYVFNQSLASYRWFRVKYTSTAPDTTSVVSCTVHLKRN